MKKINKRLKSIISIISCITLMASLTPAYALEANTSGSKSSTTPFLCGVSVFNKSTSEALLTAQPATFSVTVPTALPVNVDASGAITVATDAKIVNNSPGPVKVVSCQMNTLNNWAITSEPSKAKVGAKEFNFTLNDKAFGTDGAYDTSTWESIFPNSNLPLVYTSEVAPQKNAITEAMANIVFTIDWDKDANIPVLNATHEIDKTKITPVLSSLTGNIEFRNSKETPATYNSATDVSTTGDGSVMAYTIGQNAIVQAEGGVLAPVDAGKMFYDYKAMTLDLKELDTSKTTNMNSMFDGCKSLTSLNISSFNTSNVTDMSNMFGRCTALTSLDISSFDTSNVAKMNSMFFYCTSLTTLDVSSFDTSNVINMSAMFRDCTALTSLDVSSFDTSNVTDMSVMFRDCDSLTSLDLSSFNTSNVTIMLSMFFGCDSLASLDLSSFDTSNVININYIFQACYNLTTVYARTPADLDKLNTSSGKPVNVNIIVK